ncbi:MAG: type II toxin-antitoxin system HicB family antitoxin [Desulfomicrobium sp.]|nr:type II toxin-antitoxin system HicB family antitoxin [Desulfomicrobium sp.]
MNTTDNSMTYKGYTTVIKFSAEDDCLIGHLIGINDIVGFHGDSVEEIRKAFEEAVDFYIESCAKAGRKPNKPYSGRVTLRLPPELHAKLAVQAKASGSSLNNWMVRALDTVTQQQHL